MPDENCIKSDENCIKKMITCYVIGGDTLNYTTNFIYDSDNNLEHINQTGIFKSAEGYEFSYDSVCILSSVNGTKYKYFEDGYQRVQENNPTVLLENLIQKNNNCQREIYLYDDSNFLLFTSQITYKLDADGNIIELDKISIPDDNIVLFDGLIVGGFYETYESGTYIYDEKINKFLNLPFAVKYLLNINPGKNNILKFIPDSSDFDFLINKIVYNENNFPDNILTQTFKIENLDTILLKESTTEIEYIN